MVVGPSGKSQDRHRAFLERASCDRPLFGCYVGYFADAVFPSTMERIADGQVNPDDIDVSRLIDDSERLYGLYSETADDYGFVATPFPPAPWIEAILGCSVVSSGSSLWAEPCADRIENWEWGADPLESPWASKLLELAEALVESSAGRYPVAPAPLRGPSDMLAAMVGVSELPLLMMDQPRLIRLVAERCAAIRTEVYKAQMRLLPSSRDGYMSGGYRFWSPDRNSYLQEDAVTMLSPRLYREIFLPLDRRIAGQFSATLFHVHCSALWLVGELMSVPEITIIELNFDDASVDVDAAFAAAKRIQSAKPLVLWRVYDDGFWPWLDRVLGELSPAGLAVQVTVNDLDQALELRRGFLERIGVTGPNGIKNKLGQR